MGTNGEGFYSLSQSDAVIVLGALASAAHFGDDYYMLLSQTEAERGADGWHTLEGTDVSVEAYGRREERLESLHEELSAWLRSLGNVL